MAEITLGEPVPAIDMKAEKVSNKEAVRPSDPFKQGVAGITDLGTGLPMIAGMIGAAGQAGYNTLVDEGDQSFTKNFGKAISDGGWDTDLLQAGVSGRNNVNEFLGIQEPVSTEDQAARLAASLLPIPGAKAIAGSTKLATALNLLTPAVKYKRTGAIPEIGTLLNKGNAARVGAQTGIGVGAEQGIRAYVDAPLMFSEEALTGKVSPAQSNLRVMDDNGRSVPLGDKTAKEFTRTSEVSETYPIDSLLELGTPVPAIDMKDINTKTTEDKLKELDLKVGRAQDAEDYNNWGYIALGLLAAGTAGRYLLKSTGKVEKSVDKTVSITDALKNVGASKATRDSVSHNGHTDPIDIGVAYAQTGKLGQDFVPTKGKVSHALDKLRASYTRLGKDNQKLFDKAMVDQKARADRIHRTGNLWKNAKSDLILDESVRAARNVPEVKKLMDQVSESFDVLLDYQVHRGTLTAKQANRMREKAMGASIDGAAPKLSYMPIYNRVPATFVENIKRYAFGWNSRANADDLPVASEFGAKSINVGDDILSPLDALQRYSITTIAHANQQSFKAGVLDALARITRDNKGVITKFNPLSRGAAVPTGRDTKLIGVGTNLDDIERIPIESLDSAFKSGSLPDLQAGKNGRELVTVHQNGEIRVYHVPDHGIRAALNLNPKLSTGLQFMAHWKNLFTRGTTGNLSPFAPMSHILSSQQVAVNTAGQSNKVVLGSRTLGGIVDATQSIGRSLKGSRDLFIANGSGDIARYLAQRIAKNFANGKESSSLIKGLQPKLERRFLAAQATAIRSETGRTVSSIGNVGNSTIQDIVDSIGGPMAKYFTGASGDYNGLTLAKNLWESWNNAWHEGPAYGAMLKHIGEHVQAGKVVDAKVYRDAVDISKTLAGDMRRVGSSDIAVAFNASVPFSAAMIQSWASIGAAIKANPKQFMAGASALIGVPTITEMTYNALLSEASGTFTDPNNPNKEWTYNDYYWNGYTTQQRNDNFIVFIPGQPPWEAALVPVSPEWSLFRAMTMEGADAVFNFSGVGDVKTSGQPREQLWGAIARVTDIPLPPLLSATTSGFLGKDVRVGLAYDYKDDPDNPGRNLSLLRAHDLAGGERVTRRSGQSRYAQGEVDSTTAAALQDIFGAAAASLINVYEATKAGTRGPEGTLAKGIGMGIEALGVSTKSQMRYLQPLPLFGGKTLRPTTNDEISKNLFTGRANLKNLANQMQKGYIGAGIAYADGTAIVGNTVIPSDDPINLELAASAQAINGNIGLLDDQIAKLKKDLTTIPLSTNLGSLKEKNAKMDSIVLEIQALKAQQLAVMHEFETELSNYLSERYDRDVAVDLTSFVPRGQLPNSSISKELQLSPPTSQ